MFQRFTAATNELNSAPTANGRELRISAAGGKVAVANASVMTTDIMASNGIVYLSDTAVIP